MRSGNYEVGQRKVIFTLWTRPEQWHTNERRKDASILMSFVHC